MTGKTVGLFIPSSPQRLGNALQYNIMTAMSLLSDRKLSAPL